MSSGIAELHVCRTSCFVIPPASSDDRPGRRLDDGFGSGMDGRHYLMKLYHYKWTLCVIVFYGGVMKLTIADVERAFCERANWPLADLIVRDRQLRQAGWLSRGGHGPHAPAATWGDGSAMGLGLISSRKSQDVVDGIKWTSSFQLVRAIQKDPDGTVQQIDPPLPHGTGLLTALTAFLRWCGERPDGRLLGLSVERSSVEPLAFLGYGQYGPDGSPKRLVTLTFEGQPAGEQPDAVEHSSRLRSHALMTLVDLIKVNAQPQQDTGPSAGTDEPGSISPDNLMDRRRAPTRKRRKSA
jgi:hypothetical protein